MELPVTGAYLKRIGAVEVHFHLAKVEVIDNGYPRSVATIKFSEEGETHCRGPKAKDAKPTEEEAEGIRAEFASTEFPKIIPIAAIGEPPPNCDLNDPQVYVCHDFNDQIIMVHQRYSNQDGTKGFLPWTYWSDGKWRLMEPDVMPFYGLPGAKDHTTLVLHEGSKAAKRVKRMLNGELEVGRFPWLEEVRWAAHIGWIGGVHALARSDWAKLAAMGWKRVIIVADNDDKGRAVVPEIAEHFNCPTFVLAFTDDWPESFDLGDDWPETLFGDEGQYIGPAFSRCVQPATYATNEFVIIENDKPKTVYEIRPVFAGQWAWVASQDLLVCLDMPAYKIPAGRFNAFIRPFSHVKDTLSYFHKHFSGNQMELTYDPSTEGTVVRVASGLQAINLYAPSAIKPHQGDWGPWLHFLEHLFPVAEDREQVKRWCATLIARPDIRMIYGLLLMSQNQGVGKGTFARIIADLVGRDNTSFPSASMIVESQFNGWISGKRLICVDEIYEGHSWRAYNKLKPYITDDSVEVNVKHMATWSMPNWTHYILMSNSPAALKIEEKDRRWLVPEVSEDAWTEEEFAELYGWMRGGGLSTIAMWAKTFASRGEGKYVRAGEKSPMSARKGQLIRESRSDAERLLDEFAEAMSDDMREERRHAVTLSAIRSWLKDRTGEKVYLSPQQLARDLRHAGLWITERKKVGPTKEQLVVNEEKMLHWETGALKQQLHAPDDVLKEPL
jgi:hypothetical protein